MGFLAGEATQGELQGELLTRQFRSENETSTRSFQGTNVHRVVVSFPGTKLHGNEIIQCCQRGQLHCAMGGVQPLWDCDPGSILDPEIPGLRVSHSRDFEIEKEA